MHTFFIASGLILLSLVVPLFYRVFTGPTVIDRLVGVNLIGTKTIVQQLHGCALDDRRQARLRQHVGLGNPLLVAHSPNLRDQAHRLSLKRGLRRHQTRTKIGALDDRVGHTATAARGLHGPIAGYRVFDVDDPVSAGPGPPVGSIRRL